MGIRWSTSEWATYSLPTFQPLNATETVSASLITIPKELLSSQLSSTKTLLYKRKLHDCSLVTQRQNMLPNKSILVSPSSNPRLRSYRAGSPKWRRLLRRGTPWALRHLRSPLRPARQQRGRSRRRKRSRVCAGTVRLTDTRFLWGEPHKRTTD